LAQTRFGRKEEEKAKRILVPVKGAPVDDEAMRLAYTYAIAKQGKGRNVAVDVVYVVEVPQALPLDAQLDESIEKGEKALDHAEEVASSMGLQVEAAIIQARSAGAAIVDMAKETDAVIVVMAVDYHKKLGELDLGRTLPYVLKHCPCSVWVCRAAMSENGQNGQPQQPLVVR
jgi:nucleotide-binding universal stress UspA family protein